MFIMVHFSLYCLIHSGETRINWCVINTIEIVLVKPCLLVGLGESCYLLDKYQC
jgi:hypothetical protein